MKFQILRTIIFLFLVLICCTKENKLPEAIFTINPDYGDSSTIFLFDASLSSDSEDNTDLLLVRWDFEGDGIWETEFISLKTIMHQFTQPGTYNVSLEVKDTGGLISIVTQLLIIELGNLPPEIPSNPFPQNNSFNNNLIIELSWNCYDPETDSMLYDIYFGQEPDPPLIKTGWNTSLYDTIGLSGDEYYYWKVIAKDFTGNITEGPVWKFNTALLLYDSRDSIIYNIVKIKDQTWMAENLNYYIEKDSWCYNNDSSFCSIYGRLYEWEVAMSMDHGNLRDICPHGWHLPSDDEWKILEMGLGMDSKEAYNFGYRGTDEANKLKESGTVHWTSPNTGANNHSGFTALPAGCRNQVFGFSYIAYATFFWTSSEYTRFFSWVRELGYNNTKVKRSYYLKDEGFSIRCIKNL